MQVDALNEQQLARLPAVAQEFTATDSGPDAYIEQLAVRGTAVVGLGSAQHAAIPTAL